MLYIIVAVAFFVILPVFLIRKVRTTPDARIKRASMIALLVWGIITVCCSVLLVMLFRAFLGGMGEGIHEMNTT
jgi:hypothetical protein